MPDSVTAEIERLRQSIAGLEARRAILGEAVIEPALQALRHQIADLEALITVPAPSAEERRVLTIFYSDVIGSTTLAEKLDPEEWLPIIGRVQQTIGNIIEEHHGLVAQYQGDGLIAFFGMPQGSESDPENAIRAGLAAQHAVPELKLSLPVQIRVGIHTGLVAIGAWGSLSKIELGAFGDAMNVGARLQKACPPGSVLITNETFRLVQGIFDASPQPLLTVKGRSEPLQTYLVTRARPRSSRTVTRGVMGITSPIVGRELELARLRQEIDSAYHSREVIWVHVLGEAGIGKSRLLNEMCEYLEHYPTPVRCVRARAFEGDQSQAFGLVRRLWFDSLSIAEDTPQAQAEVNWVERFLELRGPGFEEAAHALGLLVGLPFVDSPYIGAMRNDPVQIKGRAVVVGRELLNSLRMRGPVAFLLEDMQWSDSSSLEYLAQVVSDPARLEGDLQGAAILATARPEWGSPANLVEFEGYRQVELDALDDIAGHELVTNLLKNVSGVTGKEIDLVVERAEGVPYFAEELINWFLDNGIIDASRVPWQFDAARLSESAIPATLQHLISTRLGTLRERERVILQRGSIFGRHFWEGGLAALGAQDSNPVLVQLQPRNFVERQMTCSFAGEIEWSFHHNLLREVTYESVLKRERKTLHRQAADWLTAQAGKAQRLDELAGVIAEHLDRAGASDPAANWYLRAGIQARARGAISEARRLLERSLELTPAEAKERRWQVTLEHNTILYPLGEPEKLRASTNDLLVLGKELGDTFLAEAYFRQVLSFYTTGDYRQAHQMYPIARLAAQRVHNLNIEIRLLGMMVFILNRVGDRTEVEKVVQELRARMHDVDEEALAKPLNNLAIYYVESGDMAQAAELHSQVADILHRLGDRIGEANSYDNLGYDYICLGLYDEGQTATQKALEIHNAIGARREALYARLNLGLALMRKGNLNEAGRLFEGAQQESVRIGDEFARAACHSYLALTLEQSHETRRAFENFTQAEELYESAGAQGYAADARAGLARIALAQGDLTSAREHIHSVWDRLHLNGATGMEFPILGYLTCAEIYQALGETGISRQAIEEGYHELTRRADRLSNSLWRTSYLENVPEHGALAAKWKALAHDSGLIDQKEIQNESPGSP